MDEEVIEKLPTKTYKVLNGRITGWIDELSAIRQAIEKVLQTERFFYEIYTDNYGVELQHLIGQDYDLVVSELERVIKEALMVDDRIVEVRDFYLSQEAKDSMLVSFFVDTIFGTTKLEEEVSL